MGLDFENIIDIDGSKVAKVHLRFTSRFVAAPTSSFYKNLPDKDGVTVFFFLVGDFFHFGD
jgi:hypothetical protein